MVQRRGLRGWLRRHPRWTNTLVVVIYLLYIAWVFPFALVDMGVDSRWLVPGYLIIAALLFFRHTWPLLVLVLTALAESMLLVIYPWNGAPMLGVWFLAYCVGLHRGLIWGLLTSVPASVVGYAAFLRVDEWHERYGQSLWMSDVFAANDVDLIPAVIAMAILVAFTSGASAAIGAAVRRGRAHEEEIFEWARRSHELAQLGERNRIAREMHDVVAHSLSVMISLADGARVVAKKDPVRAGEVLEELSGTGRTALADMRRVIGVLKQGEDVSAARRPVRESLEELYEGFRQAGMPLTVTTSGPPLPEDTAFGLTVHRIIQESLTNVLRYGRHVTQVSVVVEYQPGTEEADRERLRKEGFGEREQMALGLAGPAQVVITVTDDGALPESGGRRESIGSGLGIRGMQERASFYHGSVYAGPGTHRGWTVRAVLEPPRASELSAEASAETRGGESDPPGGTEGTRSSGNEGGTDGISGVSRRLFESGGGR